MITKTAQQIIDSARPATRHDNDTQVTDPQLLIWLGEHARALHSMAARVCKSQYTQSALFTVTSQTSVTIGTTPLNGVAAVDYLDFRGLDFTLDGTNYQRVKPMPFAARDNPSAYPGRRYILRGNTIDLLPTIAAAGSYRLWYIGTLMNVQPPAANTSMVLPEGGDLWLSEALSARIRVRLQQDPAPHERLQDMYWKTIILPFLQARNAADGAVIARVEDDSEGWA